MWVTIQSNQFWQRIFDFGSSNNGEVTGPGGAGNRTNYIFLGADEELVNRWRMIAVVTPASTADRWAAVHVRMRA